MKWNWKCKHCRKESNICAGDITSNGQICCPKCGRVIPKQVEELAFLEVSASDLLVLFEAHIEIWARKEPTKMKMLAMRKANSSACFGIALATGGKFVIMRTRISFIVGSFLTLISCFFYFRNIQYKNSCQSAVLEGLTPEENRSLSRMCRGLLYNSSLGYTLFGDKPVSFISVYGESRICDDQSFFQKKLLSIVRMCRQPIESSCFAIVFEKSGTSENVYLINKNAFLTVVEENLSLFQTFLAKRITPQELLQDVLKKGFSETLHGSHALFGIVLGFGRQNALNFDRSYLLYSSLDGIPPWKETRGTRCLLPKSKDFFLQEWLRAVALKENNIQPTPPFTTIQEELADLDSKLLPIPGEGRESCASASIPLPAFSCDQGAQETQALIQKYMTQRAYLETIDNNDALFEIAVNKFLKDG